MFLLYITLSRNVIFNLFMILPFLISLFLFNSISAFLLFSKLIYLLFFKSSISFFVIYSLFKILFSFGIILFVPSEKGFL